MKLSNSLSKEIIENHKLDDEVLRKYLSSISFEKQGIPIQQIGELLNHSVVYCDLCGNHCFAINTTIAYSGEYWVCKTCSGGFLFCKSCNTYVLANDLASESHTHAIFKGSGTVVFPDDSPVEVYNADILAKTSNKSGGFFKTKQEQEVLQRRLLSSRDPERVFRYFGVELEVEKIPCAPPDLNYRTKLALGSDFAMIKHDGSLSRRGKGGFEIVSMPGTLAFHKGGVWSKFFGGLSQFFLPNPPTTGLHIHIGRNTLSPGQVGKLLLFVNSINNREFIYGIANRNLKRPNPNGRLYANIEEGWKASDLLKLKIHNNDCPWHTNNKNTFNFYEIIEGIIKTDPWGNPIIKDVAPSSFVRKTCRCPEGMYNIDHYEAVNLKTSRPTVELRIFRGIVNELFLYACLEFADALVDFCDQTKPDDLLYRNYLDYVEGKLGQYPNLYRMLVNQLWINPPKEKSNPHEVIVQPYGLYS